MEKEVKHYMKNKDNKKRRNMKKRKTNANKYTLLHRSNERFDSKRVARKNTFC